MHIYYSVNRDSEPQLPNLPTVIQIRPLPCYVLEYRVLTYAEDLHATYVY